MLLCVAYRPPKRPVPREFFQKLRAFLPRYIRVVITEDFNSIMLDLSDQYANCMYEQLQLELLHLVPSGATSHHRNNQGTRTDTWLDLFIVQSLSTVIKLYKSATPLIYGHNRIDLTFKCNRPTSNPRNSLSRDFRHFNRDI